VPDRQAVVLRCRADLTVATDDDPPVPLGALPAEWAARIGPKLLRAGRLLRFSLGARGVLFGPDDGRPYGADLRYEGPANARRGRADAFSKVLFQALARAGAAPSLEALKDAADAGAGAMDADEAAAAGVAELAMQSL
jgi:snurportin-1